MLYLGNAAIYSIYTPPNLTVSIGLPEKESYAWFMPDGKSYREVTGDEYAALAPHITYVNNVNKDTATVIVNGDGEKFIGSKTATFAIVQKNITGK